MSADNKAATLSAIANAAGVSISTASRVLNRNDDVIPISATTKEKVRKAARELGYLPSMAARALRSGMTKTIGVLGTSPEFFVQEGDSSNQHVSFVSEIMRGLFNASIARGYNLMMLTGAAARTGTEMELLASFGMADGLLVLNRDLGAEDMCTHTLKAYHKPLVYALDYQDDDAVIVAPDDFEGARLATKTLLERGHKKVAFVEWPIFKDIFSRRKAGWEFALKEAGVNPAEMLHVPDVRAMAHGLIRQSNCTAALCANVPCADEFLLKCSQAEVSIPQQMEIIGFYHESGGGPKETYFADVLSPLSDMIAFGVNQLVDWIEGKELSQKKKLFSYRLQYGETCPAR